MSLSISATTQLTPNYPLTNDADLTGIGTLATATAIAAGGALVVGYGLYLYAQQHSEGFSPSIGESLGYAKHDVKQALEEHVFGPAVHAIAASHIMQREMHGTPPPSGLPTKQAGDGPGSSPGSGDEPPGGTDWAKVGGKVAFTVAAGGLLDACLDVLDFTLEVIGLGGGGSPPKLSGGEGGDKTPPAGKPVASGDKEPEKEIDPITGQPYHELTFLEKLMGMQPVERIKPVAQEPRPPATEEEKKRIASALRIMSGLHPLAGTSIEDMPGANFSNPRTVEGTETHERELAANRAAEEAKAAKAAKAAQDGPVNDNKGPSTKNEKLPRKK